MDQEEKRAAHGAMMAAHTAEIDRIFGREARDGARIGWSGDDFGVTSVVRDGDVERHVTTAFHPIDFAIAGHAVL